MENYEALLEQILRQETELQFNSFTNQDAYDLGRLLIDMAQSERLSVTADITRNGQQLFHCALEGTSADNDRWIKGKTKLVNLTGRSSYYHEITLKAEQKTIEEALHLSAGEYMPYGGSFPVCVKGAGIIGTISVSGLSSEKDHELVVRALKRYFAA